MISSYDNSAIANFCRELREARRFQQISLEEVARITRVSADYLKSLETGQWNEIPRAYLRGYLGLYAQSVGMNKEKVLRSFDQLISPILNVNKATLDETPPLLVQPEHVEVTRAKIRAAWFAALSRNRKAIYLLTFMMIFALLGTLYISRHIQNDSNPIVPFSESLQENADRVHSPLTNLPLVTDSSSVGGQSQRHSWVKIIGIKSGTIIYYRTDSIVKSMAHSAYDTVNIEYLQEITIKINPLQSAICYIGDSLVHADTILAGNTELYRVNDRKSINMVVQSPPDSMN